MTGSRTAKGRELCALRGQPVRGDGPQAPDRRLHRLPQRRPARVDLPSSRRRDDYATSDAGCRSSQDAGAETWQTVCGLAPMPPGERRRFEVAALVGEWQFGTLSDSVGSSNCSPPAGATDRSGLGG